MHLGLWSRSRDDGWRPVGKVPSWRLNHGEFQWGFSFFLAPSKVAKGDIDSGGNGYDGKDGNEGAGNGEMIR